LSSKVLVVQPLWHDMPVRGWACPNTRFEWQMEYMYWIIGELINRSGGSMHVEVLEGDQPTRANIESKLQSLHPQAYVHGSHMACNAATGSPYEPYYGFIRPSVVVCSPRGEGACYSNTLPWWQTGDLYVDCPSPNHTLFNGMIVYLVGCIAGRKLAPDMVNAGAKAVIAQGDLLWMTIGCDQNTWWREEAFLDVWVGIFDRLREHKTVGEAVQWGKDRYDYWIDYAKQHGNDTNTIFALQTDKDYLTLYGDETATLPTPIIPTDWTLFALLAAGGGILLLSLALSKKRKRKMEEEVVGA